MSPSMMLSPIGWRVAVPTATVGFPPPNEMKDTDRQCLVARGKDTNYKREIRLKLHSKV